MKREDAQYLSDFLEEFQAETDRGAALVGAALIDERIERLLRSHFVGGKEAKELLKSGIAPLGNLDSRIKMAYCLGLITKVELKECDTIRRIRNEFAHHVHGLNFNSDKVRDLCKNLKANTPDDARFGDDPKTLFINSVIQTSLALWYRPEEAEPYEAYVRRWRYELKVDGTESRAPRA